MLELSPEKVIYERTVYSVNNLMSDIGGFFNSFLFIGSILFYAFKEPLLYTSLLSKIYFYEDKQQPTKIQRFDNEGFVEQSTNRKIFQKFESSREG
mmetsp:Transcript_27243/g.20391  ORF Transcript_27243/g.20391 Transcript_27243/m.20391 type:complete len:96 (+) Transcript_27243:282-569(+)